MITIDTANDTTHPIIKVISCVEVKAKPNFTIFNRLAPNMTGIARKNVNSAATVLDTPIIKAPTIVAPERDVPGKIAAISWNIPIRKAVFPLIAFKERTRGFISLFLFSTTMKATPNTINAIETHSGL